MVSYYAPNGHYSATEQRVRHGVRQRRRCTRSPPATSANGVYTYGAGGFPTNTYNATNYTSTWCSCRRPRRAPWATLTATAGNAAATVDWDAPATGGAPTSYKVTPYMAGVAQTPVTVTGAPPATERHDHRADGGHVLHVHGEAVNAGGTGPGRRRASNAVTPFTRRRRRRPPGSRRRRPTARRA